MSWKIRAGLALFEYLLGFGFMVMALVRYFSDDIPGTTLCLVIMFGLSAWADDNVNSLKDERHD